MSAGRLACVALAVWLAAGAGGAQEAPAPAGAAPAVSVGRLDTSVDEVLQRPEYAWRLPREAAPDESDDALPSLWGEFFRDMGHALERMAAAVGRFLRWLGRKFSGWFPGGKGAAGRAWAG